MRRLLSLALRALSLLTLSLQPELAPAAGFDPLFASTATLQVTLDGPFALIDRERDKARDYPGTLSYRGPDGAPVVLDVAFEVRGNYRLRNDVCQHAQLWLNVKTRQAQGTLFESQDRIKLAVQCRPQQRYADYLVREHQAYQLFGRLTERSFATRLVDVTYRDSADPDAARTDLGMFIEHHARFAQRADLREVEADAIGVAQLEPAQASLVAIFMYMIANTDYSMLIGEEGEECCHNIRLFADAEGRYVPVPFDFDFAGFVGASYAEPAADLKLRSVRERLYRGFCVHNDLGPSTLARFRQQRSAFAAILADTTYVSAREARRAQDFIDGFFRLIEDPASVTANLLRQCR